MFSRYTLTVRMIQSIIIPRSIFENYKTFFQHTCVLYTFFNERLYNLYAIRKTYYYVYVQNNIIMTLWIKNDFLETYFIRHVSHIIVVQLH